MFALRQKETFAFSCLMRKAIRREILNIKERTQREALGSNEMESIRASLLPRLQKSKLWRCITFEVLKMYCGGTFYLILCEIRGKINC